MKNCILLLLVILVSCHGTGKKNLKPVSENTYSCGSDFSDTMRINGVALSEATKKAFLEKNPRYDSIGEGGYYYYGKSNILLGDGGIYAINIVDSNIRFESFLNINTPIAQIRSQFPDLDKRKNSTDKGYYVINLFDKHCNFIEIGFTDQRIVEIYYSLAVD
jgi:hypothetical protein